MKLSEMAEKLGVRALFEPYNDTEVLTAYAGDLLSDVMGNAPDGAVLITIQAHKNTIAVASLKESPAIIICNSRPAAEDMLEAAKDEGIAVFVSDKNQFEIAGSLYALLYP
ncbi:hypothetical protein H0R92_05935 [Treponema sp. OMZ 840]|uniref:hypothetical protein n=1 Tax=Treponema sp. OMZ 840 TaxID=244313 RepID=UPI003D8A6E90